MAVWVVTVAEAALPAAWRRDEERRAGEGWQPCGPLAQAKTVAACQSHHYDLSLNF